MIRFGRREWRGGLDMGPSWPPRPRAIVMRDRSTGTDYLLSHDSNTDEVTLTTPVPSRARTRPEEPLLPSPVGPLRLFISGGDLVYELATDQSTVEEGPVFTLNYGDSRTTYEVHADGVNVTGDALCLRRWDDLGRTTVVTDLGCPLFLPGFGTVFEDGVFEPGVFE